MYGRGNKQGQEQQENSAQVDIGHLLGKDSIVQADYQQQERQSEDNEVDLFDVKGFRLFVLGRAVDFGHSHSGDGQRQGKQHPVTLLEIWQELF